MKALDSVAGASRASRRRSPTPIRLRVRLVDRRRLRRAAPRHVSARAARRQHADQPGARVRSLDSLRRQRRRADLLRRADAARRWPARSSARRWPRPASSFRRCCAIRSPRRSRSASPPAPRSARCSPSCSARVSAGTALAGAAGQPRRRGDRRRASSTGSRRMHGRAMSTTVLLLAGVTLNSFFSALILFVQYLADFAQVYRAARWLMGDLDVGSFEPIVAALPLLVVAFAIFALLPSSLNLLSVGADAAAARGVDVGANAAARVLQRVARDGGRRIAGRPDRLHRHRRAAPRAADRRRRSSHRAAGVGAVRRGVPRRLRSGCAHAAGAGGDSGRRRHRHAGRTVLPMAARPTRLIAASPVVAVVVLLGDAARRRHSHASTRQHSASSRLCQRSPRCCLRLAPDRRWSPSAATTTFRPK